MQWDIGRRVSAAVLGMGLVAWMGAASAAYPDRPVKLEIGGAPGGGLDLVARVMADALSTKLQATFTVDNKPGAGGILAADLVTKSKPDGYTVLIVNSGLMTLPLVYAKLPYDTMRDLVGVTGIARGEAILVVSPSLKVSNGTEFLQLLKANPNKYNWASLEAYTEVTTDMFNARQGITGIKVPYRATMQMLPDIASGATHYALGSIPAVRPYVDSGKLQAIAVASPRRNPEMPNVPTFREAGLVDMEIWNRYSVFVPAGTPRPVIDRLQKAVADVIKDENVRNVLKRLTLEPWEIGVDQFQQEMANEYKTFQRVGAEAGIKPE